MDRTVKELVEQLCDMIDGHGEFHNNGRELALLDAESADDELSELEEKVEDLEWNEDDYFTIDKDKMDVIMTRVMRKMFYPDKKYTATNEEDYYAFTDDMIEILKQEMEKESEET